MISKTPGLQRIAVAEKHAAKTVSSFYRVERLDAVNESQILDLNFSF